MKNKPTTTRRTKKTAGVSDKIKTYVKKAVAKKGENFIVDTKALETLTNTASLFFQDDFMASSSLSGIPQGYDKFASFGVMFKYVLHNNSDTIPKIVRLLVLVNKRGQSSFGGYRSGNLIFEDKLGSSEGLASITGNLSDICSRIDPEHYTVLRDFTVNLGTSSQDGAKTKYGKIFVPWKKTVIYGDRPNSSFPVKDNLVFLVMPREGPNDQGIPSQIEVTSQATWWFKGY